MMSQEYTPSILDWLAFISYTLWNPLGMALIIQDAVNQKDIDNGPFI